MRQTFKKMLSLLLVVVMICGLLPMSAMADGGTTTLNGGDTITAGGTYQLAADATGTVKIETTEAVTIIGNGAQWDESYNMTSTPNYELSFDCTKQAGVNLTLRDVYITNSTSITCTDGSGCGVVGVTDKGNTLNFEGVNVVEYEIGGGNNPAAIHVKQGDALTIGGNGTLYFYKSAQGAGFGGTSGELNGDITFKIANLFAKGTKQGALIGAGSGSGSVNTAPGSVTFESGSYNLETNSRGAAIGGGAGSGGASSGTTVYIKKNASVNVNVDYSGSAIGGGGYANGNDASGGTVYIDGGSLRVYTDKNAANNVATGWNGQTLVEGTVNDAPMTAQRLNSSNEKVYRCIVDTYGISSVEGVYTVEVDGEEFYVGGLHEYGFVQEGLDKDEQLSITTTPSNWYLNGETRLFLYLTGEDHTVTVNGKETAYVWDAETSGFSIAEPEEGDNPVSNVLYGGETLTKGGTYQLAASATGTITVATTEAVTIIGNGAQWDEDTASASHGAISSTANYELGFDCTVADANLTLKDMYLSNSGVSAVNVTGTGNILTFDGTVIIDHYGNNVASIHVGPEAALTVNGTTGSRAYLYKTSQSACIGGNSGEACGEITFGVENGANDFYVFVKGSKQGAVVGNGANCSAVPGNITFNSGIYNLLGIARGAIISGSAGAGSEGAGNTIVNGGLINLNVDFSGAAIGGGGYATGNDKSGGLLYVDGGSIRTYIDSNAVSSWNSYGVTEAGVNDAAITAGRVNAAGEKDVYLLTVDTTGTSADSYTIAVDGETYYTGPRYSYSYYLENANRDTDGDGVADLATAPQGTPGNWVAMDEPCFYLYVTGEDHTVTVNGVETAYVWDAETSGFSTKSVVSYAWYEAGAETDSYTITTAEELAQFAAIVNGTDENYDIDNFSGKTVTLAGNIDLSEIAWESIGGATENKALTINSQEELTAALEQYSMMYDNFGNAYKVGAEVEKQPYNSNASYYYISGPAFAGTFDGAGYTIDKLNVNTDSGYAGLFGNVTGTVKNFTVKGSVTSTGINKDYVGGVAGKLSMGGTIQGVTSYVTVTANSMYNVGGIVGCVGTKGSEETAENTFVLECANYGAVTGYQAVGGIAGHNAGQIQRCANLADIVATKSSGGVGVGGIVGRNGENNEPSDKGTVISCYNTGNISTGGRWVGGIIGFNPGKSVMRNCYNIGTVSGYNYYNPLIGSNEGTASDSYYLNTTKTYDESGCATNTYLGTYPASDTGCGPKTEVELKAGEMVALLGENWNMDSAEPINNGYPVLKWQGGKEYVKTYAVAVGEAENGSVTADKEAAAEGDTVTLTVTPAEGYELDTLTVTYGENSEVEVTDNTFTMPASNVTVTATFKAETGSGEGTGGDDTTGGEEGGGETPSTPSTPTPSKPDTSDMDLTSTTWDGKSIDVSWYVGNDSKSSYSISTAAELAGVAALVNGLVNEDCIVYDGGDVYTAAQWNTGSYVLADSGTSGTNNQATDAYHYGITRFNSQTINIMADLDMSAGNWMPIGGSYLMTDEDASTKVSGNFCGVLDGKYHNITIICDRHCEGNYGDGANIGLVGRLGVADGDVSKGWAPSGAAVRNLAVYGSVKGNRSVGGIVGKIGKTADTATIENCANFATVTGTDAKGTGGIVGAGWNDGEVRNCYNAGAVTLTMANNAVGGISGSNEVKLVNCFNVGTITANGVSAAIATHSGGSYENCYWLSGSADMGVYNISSDEVVEKSSADMKDAAFLALLGDAFAEDTDNINSGYPVLKWQSTGSVPGTPGGDNKDEENKDEEDKDEDGENAEPLPYIDVDEDDWFYEAVSYVSANGLMNGMSETTFEPKTSASRAMIVTILYRLEGEPAVTASSVFSDVADGKWYTDAVIWANENKIVEGYGNGIFAPTADVTREQMAAILYRYAAYKGYDVDGNADLSGYTDAESISAWAAEAMTWAIAVELINGRSETTLVPKGNANRAEVATMFMRYCENIVE